MKIKNYVILVLLLLSSFYSLQAYSSQIIEAELLAFSTSKQWLRLLYFEKSGSGFKSIVRGDKFFLSKSGRTSPLDELNKSIKYFSNQKKDQCLFPARNLILNKRWPKLVKMTNCLAFDKWKNGLDAGELFLIFSSAYPNNPASMFGHTFLRFNRNRKSQSDTAKEYLGYSLAYQARTNPNDNAFMYTFKGLLGGYNAYVNIMPYYMDIGVYNNSESRDLWEYPISLTSFQKDLLVSHLWELSVSGVFDYYFFDENCSTFMVRTLEAIKLDWDIKSINDLFVVPQVVLKEIVSLSKIKSPKQRVSIQKKIYNELNSFTDQQNTQFKKILKSSENVNIINDVKVLDTAIDYWKFKNYKSHTNLSKVQQGIMYETLSKRATLPKTKLNKVETQRSQAPHLAHDISRIELGLLKDELQLGYRYGFHDFGDYALGHDDKAYFSFFEPKLSIKKNNTYLNSFKFVDILSLQDFYFALPQISWRATGKFKNLENSEYYDVSFSAGVSSIIGNSQTYMLIGADNTFYDSKFFVRPNVYIGSKYLASKNIWANIEASLDKLTHKLITGKLKLSKQSESYIYSFETSKVYTDTRLKLGMSRYF